MSPTRATHSEPPPSITTPPSPARRPAFAPARCPRGGARCGSHPQRPASAVLDERRRRPPPRRRVRRADRRCWEAQHGRGRYHRASGVLFVRPDFIYVPTDDVDAAARYVDQFGAEMVWGARDGDGRRLPAHLLRRPMILLSGHLGPQPILVTGSRTTTRRWRPCARPASRCASWIPRGPCAAFTAPSGQRLPSTSSPGQAPARLPAVSTSDPRPHCPRVNQLPPGPT